MRRLCVLLFAACSSKSASPPPASTPPTEKTATEALERAKPVDKPIKIGEAHRYRIEIPAGMVASGVVMLASILVPPGAAAQETRTAETKTSKERPSWWISIWIGSAGTRRNRANLMAPICREQSSVSALLFAAGENLYGTKKGS